MNHPAFDTEVVAKGLRDGGVPEEQASTIVKSLKSAQENLVKQQDLELIINQYTSHVDQSISDVKLSVAKLEAEIARQGRNSVLWFAALLGLALALNAFLSNGSPTITYFI